MIPLLVVSAFMWTLIVERVLFFLKEGKDKLKNSLMEEFLKKRTGKREEDQSLLEEIKTTFYEPLDVRVRIIKVLAVIAPLLGLLGTVTGMIKTFEVISVFGTGNAKLIASGISEALITTQTGLVIAIPGLYMSRFLERRSQRLKQRLDTVILYLKKSYVSGQQD